MEIYGNERCDIYHLYSFDIEFKFLKGKWATNRYGAKGFFQSSCLEGHLLAEAMAPSEIWTWCVLAWISWPVLSGWRTRSSAQPTGLRCACWIFPWVATVMQLDCIGSVDDFSGRDCVRGLVVSFCLGFLFLSLPCRSVLFPTVQVKVV